MRARLFVLALVGTSAHAQNTCDTALPISTGTHVISQIDGIQVPAPLCALTAGSGNAGEWYVYTAVADTAVTISTSTLLADTRVHVYTGSCADLQCFAGDDDSGPGNAAEVTFTATAGATYWIAFDDRWSEQGFTFSLSEGPTPASLGLVSFTAQEVTGWSQGYPLGVVDMNGDHLDDIVVPGASELFIAHQLPGGGFSNFNFPHPTLAHNLVICLAAGDLDENGYNDMLYGSGSGVSFMMANDDGTGYVENAFPEFVFCQRTNMVDINNDGSLDAFSCHDLDDNVHYIGDGTGNMVFHQGSFGSTSGNYGSLWIDHDNDGDLDLYVTKCGGDPVDQFFQNNGDGSFSDVAPGLGFAQVHQAWSSAWGDYDNDADLDVLVGASGGTDHRLYRNEIGSYTNVSLGSGIAGETGSVEWRTYDFNNDGWLDVVSNAGLFFNNGDLTFLHVANGDLYGGVGDLNGDGFLDVMAPSHTLWVNAGNGNNWISVALQGTVSNANGIGARVRIVSALGTQVRDVVSGDGFKYMSTLNAHFGLGQDTEVDHVEVRWPSGIVDIVPSPPINGNLVVVEGLYTSIAGHSGAYGVSIRPDPAVDHITITDDGAPVNAWVRIMDPAGRLVLQERAQNGECDVSALAPGMYLIALGDAQGLRFVKQ